jgi:hypothetical protein
MAKDNYSFTSVWVTCLIFLSSVTSAVAQKKLSGWVVDSLKKETIPAAHVVNKTTYKGTITDGDGFFSIKIKVGDTVVISNLGYQYYYFIYRDSTAALSDVVVKMVEENYLLSEVNVTSYKLTTNKPKAIPLKKPRIPANQELRSDLSMLASDLEAGGMIYAMFSSKAEQLAKLRQLQIEDSYRKKLERSNNRQSVIKLTGLSVNELEQFMFYCKFSAVNMHSLNDYDFLRNVQACFRSYVKEKELEGFLEQFD